MKATYNDFILSDPFCKNFENNVCYQKIFDFLSQNTIIYEMIRASKKDLPALQACSPELESFCKDFSSSEFQFDDATKQNIGKMVKVILKPFGYLPYKEMKIPEELNYQFKNAMSYSLSGEITAKLAIICEEV